MGLEQSIWKWLLLVAALGSAAAGCRESREGKEADEAPPASAIAQDGKIVLSRDRQTAIGLQTASVRPKEIQSRRSAVGWLGLPPGREVVIRAPVAGFAVKPADSGGLTLGRAVRRGDPLAQVNVFLSPQEISQLVQAKEDNDILIEQSLATMQISEAQLEAVANARGAVAGVRIDQIKESLARSRAAYQQAKDKIPFLIREPYEGDLLVKPVAIAAPAEGRITGLQVTEGQLLQAGDPVCTVADWSTLWLRVPIFEGDEPDIDRAAAAQFTHGTSSEIRLAEPVTVPVETRAATRTVELIYAVPNPGWDFRVGQSLTVTLPLHGAEEALLVPRSAVLYDDFGVASCYVASAEGKEKGEADGESFTRRRIECEGTLHGNVIVRRGLKADEVVVSVAAEQLSAESSRSDLMVGDDD
ncbi:efflux RND transporter periplasmic adaptor subunit [Planctomyces sp. SH-PL14]|uniref:efflux RND transporter periplasmic adaptor subunit n=1 Tax=Planctomyces sp. SH-PL14 TaxID=1632864 RepID=UPI00078B7531|nr:efflux RND transporter periplasmic adaptor subunit [Planctomyces sp. SH-PL14]AMV16475.1 hypothetical protein VT03_01205 [Planctomyces sp. SH-PL14]